MNMPKMVKARFRCGRKEMKRKRNFLIETEIEPYSYVLRTAHVSLVRQFSGIHFFSFRLFIIILLYFYSARAERERVLTSRHRRLGKRSSRAYSNAAAAITKKSTTTTAAAADSTVARPIQRCARACVCASARARACVYACVREDVGGCV